MVFTLAVHRDAIAAEPAEAGPVTPPIELRHDLRIDLPVTAGLIASLVTVELVRSGLQPAECRWCDSKPENLNAVDDWFRTALRRPDPHPADVTGDVIAFAVAPVVGVGLTVLGSAADRRLDGAVTDVVVATQGVLSAMLVTEVVKPIVLRSRPGPPADLLSNPDAIRSFPSGHTTEVFAIAAATGMVATMRGYRLAPVVWAAGIMLGVATAYARIAADEHYFTDTLGGAAIGIGVGAGVPYLFHRPRATSSSAAGRALGVVQGASLTTTTLPGGRVVSAAWAF